MNSKFKLLLSLISLINLKNQQVNSKQCIDSYSLSKIQSGLHGSPVARFSLLDAINPRVGCCIENASLCLIYDPCLSTTAHTNTYKAFLSGRAVFPQIILPFNSKGSYFSQALSYELEFVEIADGMLYLAVTSNHTNSTGNILLEAIYAARQINHCSYFERLAEGDQTNLIISVVVSIVISASIIGGFYYVESKTFLVSNKNEG